MVEVVVVVVVGGGGSPALRVCHPVVPFHRMGVAGRLYLPWSKLYRSTGVVLADLSSAISIKRGDLPREVQRLSYGKGMDYKKAWLACCSHNLQGYLAHKKQPPPVAPP